MAAQPQPDEDGAAPGHACGSGPVAGGPVDPVHRSGLPPVDLLFGAVREAAWALGHLALYPTGLVHRRTSDLPHETGRDTPPPVVLVHGLADNRSIFAVLRRALRRAGCSDIHLFDHNPIRGDVRGKAEQLDHYIADVCHGTGSPAVRVVGHSLGGLIARYQAQVLDRGARVETVVTLGTPHRGTAAAHMLRVHPLVRELCPDSPVIARLAGPAPDCRTRFVAYWGNLDPFVVPTSSGALRHPDLDAASVLVPGAGHLTLPACRPVVDDLCRLLTAPAEHLTEQPAEHTAPLPAVSPTAAGATADATAPRAA